MPTGSEKIELLAGITEDRFVSMPRRSVEPTSKSNHPSLQTILRAFHRVLTPSNSISSDKSIFTREYSPLVTTKGLGPMNQIATKSIVRLENEITKEWNRQNEFAKKTVESIVRIGGLLLEADALFEKTGDQIGLLDFEGNLPFEKSAASKYKQIARNSTLSDPQFLTQLPSSVHSLYQLSQIAPAELKRDITQGRITPDLQRVQIADYTSGRKVTKGKSVGRPRKQNAESYDDALTLKVARSVDASQRDELVDAVADLASKYPEVQCVFSKSVIEDRLKKIRVGAETEFETERKKMMQKDWGLGTLVDQAIEAARKNGNSIPQKWGWRSRLKKELGVDVSGEIKASVIFKAARAKGVISRFMPLKGYSDVIKVHILMLNFCDGEKSALKNLRKIADAKIKGPNSAKIADKREGRDIARAYLDRMSWVS